MPKTPPQPDWFMAAESADDGKYLNGAGKQAARSPENDANSLAEAATIEPNPLWTPEQVAQRLNVSIDWVRDHSSRKEPRLPVIRLGGGPGRAGLLRYRADRIEEFVEEMESLSSRNTRRL